MTEITRHPHGTFCWVDLSTTDAVAAKAFYGELFGWSAQDIPTGDGDAYTMLFKDGKTVCGLYLMNDALREQGYPPHWLSYVCVDSVDEVVTRVPELGGQVPLQPFDVMEYGRTAVVQDPEGAFLALWQPGRHPGAQVVGEAGTMCWNEYYTHDPEGARDFYTALLGWEANEIAGGAGEPYTELLCDGRAVGGLLPIQPEWGGMPPHWMVYFGTDDLDAALTTVRDTGGTVDYAPMEIPGAGRFAGVADPQGAHFTLIHTASEQA